MNNKHQMWPGVTPVPVTHFRSGLSALPAEAELGKDGTKSLLPHLSTPWMLLFGALFGGFHLLSGAAVTAPALEVPKDNLVCAKCPCPWNWMSFKVFPNPNQSGMIPFLGTLRLVAQARKGECPDLCHPI